MNNREEKKGTEVVYRHANFVRRVIIRSVIVTAILFAMFFAMWFVIDAVLEITVYSMIEKTVKYEVVSMMEKYRESFRELYFGIEEEGGVTEDVVYSVRRISENAIARANTVIGTEVNFSFLTNHIKTVVKGLMYFIAVVICVIFSFYVRNNPDIMISSMGTFSKKTFIACVTEDLQREEIVAEMKVNRGKYGRDKSK